MTRVAMVTNIPAPYRLPVYELLANTPGIDLCVFFFSGREPDREWNVQGGDFKRVFLRERFISFRGRFIHANPDVWAQLRRFRPDVVITTGFNPTHMLAWLYCRLHGARHVAMTDGTLRSEQTLSFMHRAVRRLTYAGTQAFVGASDGAFALYRSYGVDEKKMFKSHLCANNVAFINAPHNEKMFDFIFCGRFVAIKNPLFAIEIARGVARKLGRRTSILFVGSGEMEADMRAAVSAAAAEIDGTFAGFSQQDALPALYGAARIFLFPTQWEPWGVVANEACAAGLPVLITPVAGSAAELIRDGENGFVMPLDHARWIDAAVQLLTDPLLYESMSARARELVGEYTFDNAAAGIAHAVAASIAPAGVGSGERRPKVVIIQRRMTHYRIPLFDLMRDMLDRAGIELAVVFGEPTPEEKAKMDLGVLPWGHYVPCHYWLNNRLCWQNANAEVRGADLVVMTQENKLLFNYVFRLLHQAQKMAFWGHGRNFQAANANSLRERMKRWLLTRTDWWFAYTDLSARVVVDEAHFPADRVTVLNNSIDTHALADDLAAGTDALVGQARNVFGIGSGPVGIMIASLHAEKKIDFLLEAARRLRRALPDFELVIVGDGPERELVRQALAQHGDWIHWMGARTGREKALLLKMSTVMLNPGMVGLGILDSFVARVPMVTSDCGFHSPEIAYLDNGVNGLMTADDVEVYANAVLGLMRDPVLYQRLQRGCERSADSVSLEKMAEHFCEGIARCLGHSTSATLIGKTA
ncbi:glycosyltransferase involved in cell wall biosynthesis [Actimicrobium sp. GrIS 1.19]|uniref:glycosyltransferase family 4 protein n=1 Tax=Actimicrobium sp. GrIS 1.19 TaxID=3071708 RepID=UPI002E08CBA9|nr:glycosyltransferase involved in cell wall biosynthesis [Actimicrobium sp. GrIS 1.19]